MSLPPRLEITPSTEGRQPWIEGSIRFGDCELHLPTREFRRQRVVQPVRKRVFDLMAFLIERRPAAATHAEIAQAVWGQADLRPTVIAQAMLEARRLTGDDLDNPAYFITVRGVGYRFAATLLAGTPGATDGELTADLAELRELVEQARAAAERSDHDAALFLGERAIALADSAGANALKARAMAAAAWAALHKGPRELAVRYAYEALRLAEAEDHRAVAADARVRVAQVLFAGGDLYGALQQLEEVRIADDIPEDDPVAQRSAILGCTICGDLQRFDEAWAWLERAQRISLKCQPARRAVAERISGVNLAVKQAEAAEASGRPDEAHEHFARALALNEALREDLFAAGNDVSRMCWFGNQGIALAGLGRVDDAWPCAQEAQRLLEAWPKKASPWYATHLNELRLQWAAMYHQVGRHAEALEQLEPALACADAAGRHGQTIRLATLAAKVCEASRRFEAALGWVRRAQAAQQAQRLEQSALLAIAYKASRDHERLDHELRATRARLVAAQARLHELEEQLRALERLGTAGGHGLLPMAAFELALRHRHGDATARDLPCLIGLILVEPREYSAAWDSAASRQVLFGVVSAEIRLQLGAATVQVCAWSDGVLAFTIDGVGARRASAMCQTLQERLAECSLASEPVPGAWVFRAELFDLCAHGSFATAIAALRRLYPPGPALAGHQAPRGPLVDAGARGLTSA